MTTAKALVLIRDLMLSSQIRAALTTAGIEYYGARDVESFTQKISAEKPQTIVIDLDIQPADPFAAIDLAKASDYKPKIICFFSHVHAELAEKAHCKGVHAVYRRSVFFKDIVAALI